MISINYYYAPSSIRAGLDRAIHTVSDNIACYCTDPGIAFTRNRTPTLQQAQQFKKRSQEG